jgi:hypothetical protein
MFEFMLELLLLLLKNHDQPRAWPRSITGNEVRASGRDRVDKAKGESSVKKEGMEDVLNTAP